MVNITIYRVIMEPTLIEKDVVSVSKNEEY